MISGSNSASVWSVSARFFASADLVSVMSCWLWDTECLEVLIDSDIGLSVAGRIASGI